MAVDDDKLKNTEAEEEEYEEEEYEEDVIRILIIANSQAKFKSVLTFLDRRGWEGGVVRTLPEAFEFCQKPKLRLFL
jgi:hypothetical protein